MATVRGVFKDKARSRERQLRDLRGIGRRMEEDFHVMGIRSVAQLAREDGAELYERMCRLSGVRQDPCVLDTFRCAVAQARDPDLPSEQTDWWYWSRLRKNGE